MATKRRTGTGGRAQRILRWPRTPFRAAASFLFTVILLYWATGAAQGPGTVSVDGLARTFSLHLPADYDPAGEPLPLVVMLHGRTGDGEGLRRLTGFDHVADSNGVIAVYPDAVEGEWNFNRGLPGLRAPEHDDSRFLIELVDRISGEHVVDTSRVYLAGFSNGGFMAQRVACESPGTFAAYATVAAAGFAGLLELCEGTAPLALMLVHGSADDNIPWAGLSVMRADGTATPLLMSVPQSFGFWSARAGCAADSERVSVPPGGDSPETRVEMLLVNDCPGDGEVVLVAVVGGGHNWPGSDRQSAAVAGAINFDIDAGEVIWEFFERHPPQGGY